MFRNMLNRLLILPIFCLMILSSCCVKPGNEIDKIANRHKLKLRHHFLGERVDDISTLIEETRSISMRLKMAGKCQEANKFDSYTDVLMFGNMTIDESLNDVMKLVKNCDSKPGFFEQLFGCK